VNQLNRFPNLVILQTLSKAWGLAAIRLGMAFAAPDIINMMMNVKPPYNVNTLTQQKALQMLKDTTAVQANVQTILEQRDLLMQKLAEIPAVKQVFPSDANFFLAKVDDPDNLYDYLVKTGIILRNRSQEHLCQGCLRVTVGTPAQNEYVLDAFRKYSAGIPAENPTPQWNAIADWLVIPSRKAVRTRKTSETDIAVEIDLDGSARADVSTGLGFFDHMLEQIARHSGCDLSVKVNGDIHVDEHHTIEDTAIALGEAFDAALGDKKGIGRYGFALPMDDCAAMVLLDFGGRPELVWKAKFKREKVGELPAEMFSHFFKSFAIGARCNVYVKAKGKNEHHKIEAIFKAFARSIKMAVKKEDGSAILPSTKGLL
jgi:histidinol-phosphate aminotransferase